ncbi:MAG: hypothetical protein WAV20_06870 [Blastocatellia bacterium]
MTIQPDRILRANVLRSTCLPRLIWRQILLILLFAMMLGTGGKPGAAQASQSTGYRSVVINRVRLTDETVQALEQLFQGRVPDGDYWYDKVSGAWGMESGPTKGFIHPRLKIGGPLRADASKGRTGVFVNGRELHRLDVLALQTFLQVIPGRYWVNSDGDGGYEGGPRFFNLIQLARSAGVLRSGSGRSAISGMYDSGIGRVLGDGSYISKE